MSDACITLGVMVYNYYIDTGVGGTKPAMTYKEQQQIDQAKRMEENKKKWNSLDQSSANGT